MLMTIICENLLDSITKSNVSSYIVTEKAECEYLDNFLKD